jgi:predicted DNA-binding transcriptional regulator AlpA
METNKATLASEPLGLSFLKSREVMHLLGYSDRASFWTAVHAASIPYVRISARRILFERGSLNAWLDARTVGNRAP